MIHPRFARTCLFAVLLLCSCTALAAKSFYKWTDEEGVTHYSERQPQGKQAEKVSVFTGRSAPAATNRPNAAEDEQPGEGGGTVDGEEDPEAFKDPERCRLARKNLETMENNNRIRIKDEETGEYRFLSQQEKDQHMADARKAIDESC